MTVAARPRRPAHRVPPAPLLAVAALAVLVVALPFAGLLQRADWADLAEHLTDPAAAAALRLSLVTSLSAALLCVVLGVPLAWVLARWDFPGRHVVRGLVLLPMVLPPVVGGVALLAAFSRRSPLGGWLHETFGVQLTFSTAGAVLAATFVAMPFLVITVEGALRQADLRLEDAAAGLGAGRLTVFRRVSLPLVAPSLVAGTVLAWARALGEFGATITFAGNVEGRTRTLPLEVYLRLETDPDAAVTLSLVLVAVSLAVIVALRGRWAGRR
ncbi:MAG: ABC transporter permease [Kineosporiaceae bacterium]